MKELTNRKIILSLSFDSYYNKQLFSLGDFFIIWTGKLVNIKKNKTLRCFPIYTTRTKNVIN